MSVCDVPVISSVCDAVGEGTASLIAAPFDWLAQAMAGAAAWLFEAVWWVFDTTTLVDVTSAEYVGVYNVLFGVAVFVMLIFFCLQLITGLVHRDPTALSRAALGLAKSVLGSFLVITLTALLLEVTDQLANHPISDAVPDLVEIALRKGGAKCDNVTVLAIEWESAENADSIAAVSTQALGDEVFASTIQASVLGQETPDELDEAEIERSIREINDAIRRSSSRKT